MKKVIVLLLLTIFACAPAALAQSKEAREKYDKGIKEMDRRNGPKAEKYFNEAATLAPDWPLPYLTLGDLLALEKRYDAAADAFAKALARDDKQRKLSTEDRNHLFDALGVSQAQGRHYKEAQATYQRALKEDPNYALFEYNLSCVYAEKGDLASAIPHLRKAWELRDNLPRGVSFPDPRKDDSYRQYWDDPRFQDAVRDMVI